MGKEVRLKVGGVKDGESVYGGVAETRVPMHYYNGGLPSDLKVNFNLPSIPNIVNVYIIATGDSDFGYQVIPNEKTVSGGRLLNVNGQNRLYINESMTPYFTSGTNTLRFRAISDGTVTRVVVSDSKLTQ